MKNVLSRFHRARTCIRRKDDQPLQTLSHGTRNMDRRQFTLSTIRRERNMLSACAVSLNTALEELIEALAPPVAAAEEGRHRAAPTTPTFETKFVLRTCERERQLLKMALKETFAALDQLIQEMDDVETLER